MIPPIEVKIFRQLQATQDVQDLTIKEASVEAKKMVQRLIKLF